MSKQPAQPQDKKPREKPLSLYPLTFDEAVEKIIKAKPAKEEKPSAKRTTKNDH